MMGPAKGSDRVKVPKDSFLRRTRQLWKLVVGVLILPLPTAAWGLWCLRRIRSELPTSELAAELGVLVAGALIIASLLASVRCPRCRVRLIKTILDAPEGA